MIEIDDCPSAVPSDALSAAQEDLAQVLSHSHIRPIFVALTLHMVFSLWAALTSTTATLFHTAPDNGVSVSHTGNLRLQSLRDFLRRVATAVSSSHCQLPQPLSH